MMSCVTAPLAVLSFLGARCLSSLLAAGLARRQTNGRFQIRQGHREFPIAGLFACARGMRHFVWSTRAGFCVRLVCDFCLCMLSLIAGQLKPNPDSVSASDTVTHLFIGRDSGGFSPSGPGRRGVVGAPGP